jgi:lipid-A-disaccharide synthase-like uncharacterized protein
MGSASYEKLWLAIGALGQILFTARFVVQWAVSEKKRDSVVPVAFWWLSLLGGLILFTYVLYRRDPVLIVGQSMGVVVYIRNLMLVSKAKRRAEKKRRRDAGLDARTQRIDAAETSTIPS